MIYIIRHNFFPLKIVTEMFSKTLVMEVKLRDAAERGDIQAATSLLDRGVNVDFQ